MKQKKKLLLGFLTLFVICIGIGIWYFGFGGESFVKEKINDSSQTSQDRSPTAESSTPVEGGGESREVAEGIVRYSPPEEDFEKDPNGGYDYVSNLIKVVIEGDNHEEIAKEIAKEYDGKVVGWIKQAKLYYIKLNKKHNKIELKNLTETIIQKEEVRDSWIVTDMAGGHPTVETPNDSAWADKWDGNPKTGGNHGAKAIKAPSLWGLADQMDYTNVGVMDTSFMDERRDIHFKEVFNNEREFLLKLGESDPRHGTHVAGTLAAMHNNGEDISGIAPKVNLYGASIPGMTDSTGREVNPYEMGFTYLIAMKKCRVVNFSWGLLPKTSTKSNIEDLRRDSNFLAQILQQYLKEGNEFVIVKAAGNGNDKIDGGMLASNDILSDLEDKYQDITDRIIIVGSMKYGEHNTFASEFSNYGERVDVMAPGENIESLGYKLESKILGDKDSINGYNIKPELIKMSGTSMAAPHVSGVAASLFGLDSSLTGAEVKQIICETATTNCQYEDDKFNVKDYKLVDAGAAAREALKIEVPNTGIGTVSESEFFASLPREFVFTSGAGGWQTILTVDENGNFSGDYRQGNNQGIYRCLFEGTFSGVEKISDFEYKMKATNLRVIGPEEGTLSPSGEIINPTDRMYGMDDADEIRIYLPGRKTADLPEGFLSWMYSPNKLSYENTEPELPFYGLYNVKGSQGFYGDKASSPVKMTGEWVFENSDGSEAGRMDISTDGTGTVHSTEALTGEIGDFSFNKILFEEDPNATWENGYILKFLNAQSSEVILERRIVVSDSNTLRIISYTASGINNGQIIRVE